MRNLDTPVWSNDGKHVLYMGRHVRGADPKTFEILLGNYARDACSVFFHTIRSPKIDRATFKVLNANFGIDSTQAYFVVTAIRDADPQSFRVLDSSLVAEPFGEFLQAGYAADANSVWFASGDGIFRIKTADSASFVSLGNRFGYDHARVYYENSMLVGAHRVTWRPWRGLLSVDKDNVFYINKKVVGVDRASIRLLPEADSFMDRHRIYRSGQACARDPDDLLGRKVFERLLDEWPKNI